MFAALTSLPQSPHLIVHAAESWHADVAGGRFDFFRKLGARALAEGYAPALLHSPSALSTEALGDTQHLHLMIGPRAPVGPHIWHVHPSYLRGFWYLDRLGVNMQSSLSAMPFPPQAIDAKAARYFFDGVAGWTLRQNASKFAQADRRPLPPAYAVIYAQDLEHFATPVHYINTVKILRTVARAAQGARVYVKPHPAQGPVIAALIAAEVARFGNLVLSQASIHDLTAASARVVTQNSAAGFEALLQRKPVLTCADCDYHAATTVVRKPHQMAQALANAPARAASFPFEAYVYWFLAQQMLEPTKPDFEDRAWTRLSTV
ncbi:MAG: hypothetical protein ACOH2M_27355 [Cypionkella sp.]